MDCDFLPITPLFENDIFEVPAKPQKVPLPTEFKNRYEKKILPCLDLKRSYTKAICVHKVVFDALGEKSIILPLLENNFPQFFL